MKETQTKRKPKATAKKQRLTEQILTLRANPAIKSNRQIAQILDINEGTVCRRLKEVEPELRLAQERLKEYEAQFNGGMNIAARAERYKQLANQSTSPAVALQTLIRIDDLTGITTEKDRLRAINLGDAAPQQGPMFLMAPGSTVNLGVTRHNDKQQQENETVTVDVLDQVPSVEGDDRDGGTPRTGTPG